ncbi:MAG TPA: carboxypeptidase-like regulatory domain-containing protein [Chitinophagaceae bacterium]|nr:carboxypeptidase-like regulatory domain-containing protein [Chitinophagaceae bacterium]
MKKVFLFTLVIFFCVSAFNQANFTVSGKVVDSTTKEPLAFASVFCQNTTQGTATNKEGSFYMSLKEGGYDLVITYTGYKSQLIRISPEITTKDLQIEMVKEEKSIEEVVIRSSNEVKDGWTKYGKFFLENFIGSTPFASKCVLQNPEVLKFYYFRKSEKLKVLADSPLLISNNALGYNLRYNLDSFLFMYKTDICSYKGLSFYEEKTGSEDSIKLWKKNRQKAYFGSRLHFMHSYFDSALTQAGFIVALLDEKDDKKFNKIKEPYDTAWYTAADSVNEIDIYFPARISITYTKQTPENEYLKKYKLPMSVGVQVSYIDVLDVITIKPNGYYFNQSDWINFGYWSWKNIADQVPNDYIPD